MGWIPAVKVWSASIAPYLEQYWARALVYSGSVQSLAFFGSRVTLYAALDLVGVLPTSLIEIAGGSFFGASP